MDLRYISYGPQADKISHLDARHTYVPPSRGTQPYMNQDPYKLVNINPQAEYMTRILHENNYENEEDQLDDYHGSYSDQTREKQYTSGPHNYYGGQMRNDHYGNDQEHKSRLQSQDSRMKLTYQPKNDI
ncbi:hypothetical protein BpHYR1_001096 [Brachionus plicatilis]|uniref:Uncharacterized protein n=1 Tax=Brachionus plicatilis TaxID=10195 RepID=A0A3M7SX43_BRAPC|nr:hypothetical protein BpHYR1_001096 [Brachionus plicatilis]